MRLCRNCEHWYTTAQWYGNCEKHPWEYDKASEEAENSECTDFLDKYEKYKTPEWKAKGVTVA